MTNEHEYQGLKMYSLHITLIPSSNLTESHTHTHPQMLTHTCTHTHTHSHTKKNIHRQTNHGINVLKIKWKKRLDFDFQL